MTRAHVAVRAAVLVLLVFVLQAAIRPDERRDWSEAHGELAESVRERLETWRAAQLGYYSNPVLQASQYAPVLPEPQSFVAWTGIPLFHAH